MHLDMLLLLQPLTSAGDNGGSHHEGHMVDHRKTEGLTFDSHVRELGIECKHPPRDPGRVTIPRLPENFKDSNN